MTVDSLAPGRVQRAQRTELQAGGKGVNVARTLRVLDEPCEVLGLIAGRTGDYIDFRLEQEGLARALVRLPGESRTSVILLESDTGRQTVINEAGPTVPSEAVAQAIELFTSRLPHSAFVVLTGSIPPGVPMDIYAQFIKQAQQAGKPVLLDAAGEPLRQGTQAGPTIVKPNQHEASWLCDCAIDSAELAGQVARQLVALGAAAGAITLGSEGMVVAHQTGTYWLRPPVIEARNAVGAGDATAAGLAAGQAQGLSLLESARLAVACGTASARHGFGRCPRAEIEAVKTQITVTEIKSG